jgi:hypothetical protein
LREFIDEPNQWAYVEAVAKSSADRANDAVRSQKWEVWREQGGDGLSFQFHPTLIAERFPHLFGLGVK